MLRASLRKRSERDLTSAVGSVFWLRNHPPEGCVTPNISRTVKDGAIRKGCLFLFAQTPFAWVETGQLSHYQKWSDPKPQFHRVLLQNKSIAHYTSPKVKCSVLFLSAKDFELSYIFSPPAKSDLQVSCVIFRLSAEVILYLP